MVRRKLASVTPIAPAPLAVVIIPRLLRIPDAAKYLSATTWFVEQLVSSGDVPSFIQGKVRVIDRLELDKYIDRRNAEPAVKLTDRAANLRVA